MYDRLVFMHPWSYEMSLNGHSRTSTRVDVCHVTLFFCLCSVASVGTDMYNQQTFIRMC